LIAFATVAQEIGHLGIESDPIPLVQARRASKRRVASTAVSQARPLGASLPEAAAGGAVIITSAPPAAPIGGLPGRSFDDLMTVAEGASRQGQYEPALEAYRAALQSRPDSVEAKLGLA
jgi:hypothetical protein